MIHLIEQTCPSWTVPVKKAIFNFIIISVSYSLYLKDGGDEGGFQYTFRHPTLPNTQSVGITDIETPKEWLK